MSSTPSCSPYGDLLAVIHPITNGELPSVAVVPHLLPQKPAVWGTLLHDVLKHLAGVYAQFRGFPEREAAEQIMCGFSRHLESPADPLQVPEDPGADEAIVLVRGADSHLYVMVDPEKLPPSPADSALFLVALLDAGTIVYHHRGLEAEYARSVMADMFHREHRHPTDIRVVGSVQGEES